MPKQFVRFFSDNSLFQKTLLRNLKFSTNVNILLNEEHFFLAKDQLEELEIKNPNFIVEPIGRNTAAAIAIASFSFDYDDLVLVLPSDHLIKDEKEYEKVIKKAKELALQDYLVTFGITPTSAQTGFGYIEADGYDVKAFHEKPDLKTAKSYMQKGNYYWNSGMFCFKAGVFLDELKKHSQKIYETSKEAYNNASKIDFLRLHSKDLLKIPEDSIDYAVMEKTKRIKVVPSDIKWNDLGSFDALYEELQKDKNGNTKDADIIPIEAKNNLVMASKKVALVDVEDLVVISTNDALLISKRGSTQKVKDVVVELKKQNSDLPNVHLTVHRPWGTYTVLENSTNYKIKKIIVKPKKRLSLQKHFHRNEHWVVASGTAIVKVDGKEKVLTANESTYIHAGVVHRLENQGNIDLVLIEVQVGEYLGEDDIVRLEDDYKRE